MNDCSVDVYRRNGVILITAGALASGVLWNFDPDITALPADTDDRTLGEAIMHKLQVALAMNPTEPISEADWEAFDKKMRSLVGVRTKRDFKNGTDLVSISPARDQQHLTVTPHASGFGSWGGEVEVPADISPETLARQCREAWGRGGVPNPAEGIPSHT